MVITVQRRIETCPSEKQIDPCRIDLTFESKHDGRNLIVTSDNLLLATNMF